MMDAKQNTLQRRFEHVLHNNKSKDIIASLISNADALDKSLARILGTKSENFVIDPHSRKTGLVISDIKGSDKNIVRKEIDHPDGDYWSKAYELRNFKEYLEEISSVLNNVL